MPSKTAARISRQERPDLVLMDLDLPDMTGQTATMVMKRQLGEGVPPIVAFTAYNDGAYQKSARQAGCADFIAKLYRPSELLSTIQRLLASNMLDTQEVSVLDTGNPIR